jgi:hypothetical protein
MIREQKEKLNRMEELPKISKAVGAKTETNSIDPIN